MVNFATLMDMDCTGVNSIDDQDAKAATYKIDKDGEKHQQECHECEVFQNQFSVIANLFRSAARSPRDCFCRAE
jgi:hypothetical protein